MKVGIPKKSAVPHSIATLTAQYLTGFKGRRLLMRVFFQIFIFLWTSDQFSPSVRFSRNPGVQAFLEVLLSLNQCKLGRGDPTYS